MEGDLAVNTNKKIRVIIMTRDGVRKVVFTRGKITTPRLLIERFRPNNSGSTWSICGKCMEQDDLDDSIANLVKKIQYPSICITEVIKCYNA